MITILGNVAMSLALLPLAAAENERLDASETKPLVTAADYGRFETLRGSTLSPDGTWVAIAIRRGRDENELRIRRTKADGSGEERIVPYGTRPTFSKDSAWLAYHVGKPPAGSKGTKGRGDTKEGSPKDEAAKDKDKKSAPKPDVERMVLLHLETGVTTDIEGPTRVVFSEDSRFAVMRYPATSSSPSAERGSRSGAGGSRSGGADIVVRDLATEVDMHFGDIGSFAWMDEGHLLAMLIDSPSKGGNGIRLYDPAERRLTSLHSSRASYSNLVWADDTDSLAAMMARGDDDRDEDTHVVLAWGSLKDTENRTSHVFDPADSDSFPPDTRINSGIRWSKSSDALLFKIEDWKPKEREQDKQRKGKGESDSGETNVEIWHTLDETLFPAQARGRGRDEKPPESALYRLSTAHFQRVDNAIFERVVILPGEQKAMGLDETPYAFDAMFGRGRRDVYLIDIDSGEHHRIAEGVLRTPTVSPLGRHLLYMTDHQYVACNVSSGETTVLTDGLSSSFVDLDNDHPVPEQPGYGVAGWTAEDRAVVVYDKFDLWRFESDGSGTTRLTDGRERGLVFRIGLSDPDEDHLDLSKVVYLRANDPKDKRSGYAKLQDSRVEVPLLLDCAIRGLQKAEDADVFAFTLGAFDDSPDYFIADKDLTHWHAVSNTNAFQAEFAWGRSEVIHYQDRHHRDLQGALYYPANFDPTQKYPMVVYMYEKLSDSVHRYVVPSETDVYNTTVFTQNGYFVLKPDIQFEPRRPGPSLVDCVEAALREVISHGKVDPDRIGCIGHSWGGYDSSYLATHSDMFATAIAGAPVTNLLTMWGTISEWGSPETSHNEVGQERMEVPWWADVEAYIESSPVYGIEQMKRPMLMMFGGADGNVNPLLGYEFYNAARRLGKPMVLLVYPGENHGLRQKPNQIDYQQRILEWYGVYLLGAPAPRWITDGIPFDDIDEERKRIAKKAADEREPPKVDEEIVDDSTSTKNGTDTLDREKDDGR